MENAGFSVPRRDILKSVTAATVLAALPWGVRESYARTPFDLIVIGGGTAGLPTAIFAANRGARVVVIEKAATIGGSLFVSGGMMAAADTVFQRAKGIKDSPEAHYEDVMRISGDTADPVLTRLWAEHGGSTVDWLAENGFSIGDNEPVLGSAYDPYSIPRYLWAPERGNAILNVLRPLFERLVAAGRVTLLTEAEVVDLIGSGDGRASGVVVQDSQGRRSDLQGRTLVIASGGCASNPAMFQSVHGVPLYRRAAWPQNQGAGLSLGLAAGGFLRGADNYVGYYGWIPLNDDFPSAPSANMSIDPKVRPPWEVFVNAEGQRFVQEDHPSINERDRIMDLQPGHRFWAVFDQRVLDEAPSLVPEWSADRLMEAFRSHMMFTRASSLSELGVVAGIHPRNLENSVRAYNEALRTGSADPLGRTHRPLPIAQPPFYAIRSQTWTLKSYAGLAVNENLQLITPEGAPIANVYAAGEVLGAATSGKSHTSGGSVTPALTFGRLLGSRILQF